MQQEQQKLHVPATEAEDIEVHQQAAEHASKRRRKLPATDDTKGLSAAAAAAANQLDSSDDSGVVLSDADLSSLTDSEYHGDGALSSSDADDGSSSSIDLEAEYEAQQQQQQQVGEGPPDDSELDAQTLAALDKLRQRWARHDPVQHMSSHE